MASTFVFPDGVRLATEDEILGSQSERTVICARIRSSNIARGFVFQRVEGERFSGYAEANVDAPAIWRAFQDLCQTLLADEATLLFAGIDEEEPQPIASASLSSIVTALRRHESQLTHDGLIQFGIVSDDDRTNEVFVAPTKHLKIWLSDEIRFKAIMAKHGLPEVDRLEFFDEYPRTTITLPTAKRVDDLVSVLSLELRANGHPN